MVRLKSNDRMIIQACLTKQMSITEIATRLKRNKSTISREISSHIEIHEGFNDKTCTHEKEFFVCNGCKIRGTCSHRKRYYNFETAHQKACEAKVKSRSKTKLSKRQIALINEILLDEVRNLKQSLHHVYTSNPILISFCSERTIRRAIYRGNFDVKAHELRKYVVYKHEYEKKPNCQLRDLTVILGRTYADYLNYVKKHKSSNYVQYDSVIGKIVDNQAILTITFPKYGFQFGLLIEKSNPNSVNKNIRSLFRKLGIDKVKKIFAINLADNGAEFSFFNLIEEMNGQKVCRTFFTNPYKATDKAHCERYHEFIRYFIPKGKSIDFLTQEKLNWMFSQINSYVRKGLSDRTPYELVERKYGKEFLEAIGIVKVQKKKVSLSQLV